MKTIEPVQIWTLGQVKLGTVLNAYVVSDNLSNSATFYFAIQGDTGVLSQGNLTMSGADYDGFTTNEYAYNWIAAQLGVTITGDVPPPQPEPAPAPPVEEPAPAPAEEPAPTPPVEEPAPGE